MIALIYLICGLAYFPVWRFISKRKEASGFPGQYPTAELTVRRMIGVILLWPIVLLSWILPAIYRLYTGR